MKVLHSASNCCLNSKAFRIRNVTTELKSDYDPGAAFGSEEDNIVDVLPHVSSTLLLVAPRLGACNSCRETAVSFPFHVNVHFGLKTFECRLRFKRLSGLATKR